MAAAAVVSEFAIVNVIRAMTITAAAVNSFYFDQRSSMTIVAANSGVCAVKRKVGLKIVIERPDVPCNRVVTRLTAITHIAFVRVVVTVAGNAVHGLVRIGLTGVAAITFLFHVLAVQREAGQVVIEKHRILPVHFRMAALALCAKHAFVWIVIKVAGVAARH